VLKIIVSIRTSTFEKIVEGIWLKDGDAKKKNKQAIKYFFKYIALRNQIDFN
jgi:hypothetical protein